ncbi:MAG: DUF4342 domain-containing protein [Trueperaceae bacterium]
MSERHDSEGRQRTDARAEGQRASGERTVVEEFRVRSEDAIAKIKELVREGNVRRITIKNEEGKTLIEVPLTVGVIGTLLLPAWAAVGAIAALVANLTLAVERRDTRDDGPGGTGPAGNETGGNEPDPSPAGEDEMRGNDRPA